MSLALIADADLVARCRGGDQDAWDELVNRFSRYVYAITSRVYRLSQHDAEDVFQDVFARTFEHLDELRDDAAVRPWIATLTRRLCVDKLRAGGGKYRVSNYVEIVTCEFDLIPARQRTRGNINADLMLAVPARGAPRGLSRARPY